MREGRIQGVKGSSEKIAEGLPPLEERSIRGGGEPVNTSLLILIPGSSPKKLIIKRQEGEEKTLFRKKIRSVLSSCPRTVIGHPPFDRLVLSNGSSFDKLRMTYDEGLRVT